MREIPRIGWQAWEGTVAYTTLAMEKNRFDKSNRYQNAALKVQALLQTVRKRHEEMQTLNEEMESNNEELEATNEELQSTTEEMERASAYRQTLMNSMVDILMVTDPSGIITEINRATEKISGYSREELIGQPFRKFFTDPDRAQAGIDKVVTTKLKVSNYSLVIVIRDGGTVPVSYNAVPLLDADGNVNAILGSARDVTETLQAEEAVRLASAYNRSLIESSRDPMVTIDRSGKISDCNSATLKATGCSREEFIGTDFSNYFSNPEMAKAGYEEAFKEGQMDDVSLELRHKDGRLMPVMYNANDFRDEKGEVKGVFITARDVSKRKKAEDELHKTIADYKESQTQLIQAEEQMRSASAYNRSLIESSPDPMVTIDRSGKISDCNSATLKATGCSREELMGTDFSNYFSNPEMARAGYEEAFKEGHVEDYSLEIRHKDGRLMPVMYNASVFRDEAGEVKGLFITARDISKRKKAEDELHKTIENFKNSQSQLIQASKMSAVGTMTAGIAHELNNPMMGIINFIQYVLKHTEKDDKRYKVLEDAEREVRRASSIVQNLLSFSHMEEKGAEASQKESCDTVINRVIDLLAYRIESQNVLLKRHTDEGTPEIWMNANNIQQVFFNLINNALHAVEESAKKEVSVNMRRSGEFVETTVGDSGIGIAPENLDKIFDLFYTTKPAGKGLGLGLSTTYSIIRAHGGEITCESEPGKGTTFKVLLPIERRIQKEG
jgi:PAS domain S-box-containing protein